MITERSWSGRARGASAPALAPGLYRQLARCILRKQQRVYTVYAHNIYTYTLLLRGTTRTQVMSVMREMGVSPEGLPHVYIGRYVYIYIICIYRLTHILIYLYTYTLIHVYMHIALAPGLAPPLQAARRGRRGGRAAGQGPGTPPPGPPTVNLQQTILLSFTFYIHSNTSTLYYALTFV